MKAGQAGMQGRSIWQAASMQAGRQCRVGQIRPQKAGRQRGRKGQSIQAGRAEQAGRQAFT
jgi:hypothetical protein